MKNRAQCNNFLLDIQDFALRALLCRTWYGQRLENCPEKDSSPAARALPVVQVTGGGVNWTPMSATTNIPVEVYLRSSYEPDAEYVDGEIEERPMGEDDHSAWQEAICFWFRQHAQDWNVRIRPVLRIQVAPTRFRVPDVTVLDRAQPNEQIVTHPPLAVLEVLSPEDSLQGLKRKLEDYKKMGVQEIWVIDPQDSVYYGYDEGQLLRKDSFALAEKGIAFEMDRIKELVD
jgi:Uma2 family endonuclease